MVRLNTFFIFILFAFTGVSFSQQYCIPGRFDTTYYFSLTQIDTLGNISYGQNKDWQGNTVNLKFIISYPKLSVDPLPKRPFILLMHGGGFYFGDKYDLKIPMLDFSLRGYVCASIDYRVGWNTGGTPSLCQGDGMSMAKAVYRAMQDSKAAFRYFKANANLYGIDTNYMFAAGISAGAVTSMMIPFTTQQDINSVYPTLVQELGLLDTASNSYRNSFKIKIAVSVSGGLFDTTFIKPTNSIPVLMFHGTADVVVPYGTGYAYNCTNYLRTMGSSEIKKRYRNLKKPFELDYVPGGGHENYYPIEYYQKRSALFLRRYLCNNARQVIIENYTTLLDTSLGSFINVSKIDEKIPNEYKLFQNYPNPFNPVTIIKFQMPNPGNARIYLYDMLGREVAMLVDGYFQSGVYEFKLDAGNTVTGALSSGIYFYKFETEGYANTKKLILLK